MSNTPAEALKLPSAHPLTFGARTQSLFGISRALSAAELALFAEMLSGLVRARMPLPAALKMVAAENSNGRLKETLLAAEKDVAAGIPLGQALRREQGQFPELFIKLLDQGLAGSDLHAALIELVREYRSQARFREQLWSNLLGPLVTAIFFCVIVLTLVVYMIPKLYLESPFSLWWGRRLPFSANLLIALSKALHNPASIVIVVLIAAALVLLVKRVSRNVRVRYSMQRLMLQLPVIGPYLRTVMLARFCRILSMLLVRRIPLNAALALVRDCTTVGPLRESVAGVAERVEKGSSLPDAMAQSRFFPPTLASFVSGAQVHGEMPETLSRLAQMYEERGELQGAQVRLMLFLTAQFVVGAAVFMLLLSSFSSLFGLEILYHR